MRTHYDSGSELVTLCVIPCPRLIEESLPKGSVGRFIKYDSIPGLSSGDEPIELIQASFQGHLYWLDPVTVAPFPQDKTGKVAVTLVNASRAEIFHQEFESEDEFWDSYRRAYLGEGRMWSITQNNGDKGMSVQRCIFLDKVHEIRLRKTNGDFTMIENQLTGWRNAGLV